MGGMSYSSSSFSPEHLTPCPGGAQGLPVGGLDGENMIHRSGDGSGSVCEEGPEVHAERLCLRRWCQSSCFTPLWRGALAPYGDAAE